MTSNKQNNQNFLLSEGSSRDVGRTAQRMNILAAKLVGETVRTTLGPQGMDKMIVNALGEVTITNDGATILREMNIEHPTAKMIVEIAITQEEEVGDGTTTAVVLAGELLKQAENLLEQNIHPTIIIKGFRLAARESEKILNEIAEHITDKDKLILHKLAMTSMTGKVAEDAKEHLAKIVVGAISHLEDSNKIENIKVEKKIGSSVHNTELIEGIVIDKEKIHPSMPGEINNAKIALISGALEIPTTETESKISITDPSKLQEFLDMEENMLKKQVEKIISVGANVVFCQKGVDDVIQYLLAKQGIYATRRVKKSDLEKLSSATGAVVVNSVNDLQKEHIGRSGLVEEVKVGDEMMTFVRNCKNARAVTILVRATTEHLADEIKRAIDDSLGNVSSALSNKLIVGGAGASEIELSKQLKKFAESLDGKERLAVLSYADAMEIIPRTLAENAGLDPVDVISDLNAAHDKGNKWAGLNVFSGKHLNSLKEGIVEPLKVKTQALTSASEVAVLILRIDDIIVAGADNSPVRQNPSDEF
ncbi:MAG: thermosome subunit alpha [Candidatus Woesearchaeota archaeon]